MFSIVFAVIIVISICILIAEYHYINQPENKMGLIELTFGLDHDYAITHQTQKISFLDTCRFFVPIAIVAGILRIAHFFGTRNPNPAELPSWATKLYQDENYLKLFKQFPFFTRGMWSIEILLTTVLPLLPLFIND